MISPKRCYTSPPKTHPALPALHMWLMWAIWQPPSGTIDHELPPRLRGLYISLAYARSVAAIDLHARVRWRRHRTVRRTVALVAIARVCKRRVERSGAEGEDRPARFEGGRCFLANGAG